MRNGNGASPMVVYPSYPGDQHHMTFRAPNLPTPSVNQMVVSKVANLPSDSVLCKEAAKCQSKIFHKYRIALQKASGLEELLHDVCSVLLPKPSDYDARRDLIRIFNQIIKEVYGYSHDAPHVLEFGSFSMNLFVAKSDLDLSVNFSNVDIPRRKKIQTIKKLAKKFYSLQGSGHVSGVNPILTAMVPVLKVVDNGTGIECDISIGNKDGISKSKILYFISLIDIRFRQLCFLMKAWAKAQNINSAKDRTLNSLSIILLVAFHLQNRSNPILPPFSEIIGDSCDAGAVAKSIHKFENYGQDNTESVADLFLTLLIMLSSVDELWSRGLCVSTYKGCWVLKTWDNKVGCITVEDFTDRTQNVARAVGEKEMKRIYECINLSLERISDFSNCQMNEYALREFLFGKDVATLVGDHKATQQRRHVEHSPYHTASGKRTRIDGSSVLSTRLVRGPLIDGKMERRMSMPYDMARRETLENRGGVRLVGQGGTHHGWVRAEQSIPIDPFNTKRPRNTGAFGNMHYSGTGRAPYSPIPIARPIYASNMGNGMSPMVVYPSYPHDQHNMTFRAPNLPSPSFNPTFPPIVNQMVPRHASEVANLPSDSGMLGYPLAGPNSPFP